MSRFLRTIIKSLAPSLEKSLFSAAAGKTKKRRVRKKKKIDPDSQEEVTSSQTMGVSESLSLFNFTGEEEVCSDLLKERYIAYYQKNSPENQGSIYLQAKIENAKETLVKNFALDLGTIEFESPEDEESSVEKENEKDENEENEAKDEDEKKEEGKKD